MKRYDVEEMDVLVPVRCVLRRMNGRVHVVIEDAVTRVAGEFILKEFETMEGVKRRARTATFDYARD